MRIAGTECSARSQRPAEQEESVSRYPLVLALAIRLFVDVTRSPTKTHARQTSLVSRSQAKAFARNALDYADEAAPKLRVQT